MTERETAGPSAALRFGWDDKGGEVDRWVYAKEIADDMGERNLALGFADWYHLHRSVANLGQEAVDHRAAQKNIHA